jgi:SAM-dependent methyltransferase
MEPSQIVRQKVQTSYSAAANKPGGAHPFPVGRTFAESLGYSAELLSGLPSISVDAFAGVSNVALFADIGTGATILDLGCGAGLDTLIAARRAGATATVVGIDFSDAMLCRARQGAKEAGMKNVLFSRADAERLPLADESIDIAIANGIFNLNPARSTIFKELGRVVRPGGSVYAAELVLSEPLPAGQQTEDNWFA